MGFYRASSSSAKLKNRPAGTLETKGVNVDAQNYLDMNIKGGGVFNAIRRKLHHLKGGPIYVQHDGAKSHTGKQKLTDAGSRGGWSIQYVT